MLNAANSESFGDLLRKYRSRAGFSQEALAERAAISAAAIGALERGTRRAPYVQTVRHIADALDLQSTERASFLDIADRARDRRPTNPPSGAAVSRSRLPVALTSFIERPEIDVLAQLVRHHRLVTIAGPGGIGKTRSAIEVATRGSEVPDARIRFFDLSEITDGDAIVSRLAGALEGRMHTVRDAFDDVVRYLATGDFLLVLDNCEHVVDSVASLVLALLTTCPELSLIVTSREPLGLSNEVVFRLPPLDVPDGSSRAFEEAAAYPAFALFVARARSADPHIDLGIEHVPLVTAICRRLDGIPLAIELATARLPTLGLDALATRLGDTLPAPVGRDRPLRQQTMEATIAWSYDLLTDAERSLLRRLCIFVGGFTLEAAEDVCSDEPIAQSDVDGLLSHLVQKSLVTVRDNDGATRYGLLESVRVFASRRLAQSGESATIAHRHARWLTRLADYISAHRSTLRENDYLPEYENARSALQRYVAGSESEVVVAARIMNGFRRLLAHDVPRDGRVAIANVLLRRIDRDREPFVALRLIWGLLLEDSVGDATQLRDMFERAIELCRRIENGGAFVMTYHIFALTYCRRGWASLTDEALQRAADVCGRYVVEPGIYVGFLVGRAYIYSVTDRLDEARADLQRAVYLTHEKPFDENRVNGLITLAEVECAATNYDLATHYCREALRCEAIRFDQRYTALANLAGYRVLVGDIRGARDAAFQAFAIGKHCIEIPIVMQHVATIAALLQHPVVAARLLGYVQTWYRRSNRTRLLAEQRGYDLLIRSLAEQLGAEDRLAHEAAGSYLDFPTALRETASVATLAV